jgi:glycosyltransferase involved in cell wall biosynthesis
MNISDLKTYFDAVIMLTWSNWRTEPRSNRYHYATRFAQHLPVLFVEPWAAPGTPLRVELTEVPQIDLVRMTNLIGNAEVDEFVALLNERGIHRPLVWIYDTLHYQQLIDALPCSFRIYHATEDYLTDSSGWNQGMQITAESVIRTLPHIDLLVGVSERVVESYRTVGGYTGPTAVVENGCDAEYFLERVELCSKLNGEAKHPIAIFQGGINQRLDYSLILDLVRSMPDWEFRFCGAAIDSPAWLRIKNQPNVHYLGALTPDEFTRQMCEATIGIIPYIQDRWILNSFPLKAYEYVACGLPVVTVPVDALRREPDYFAIAETAVDFANAMRRLAPTRYDPVTLARRREAALANSYNSRFQKMVDRLLQERAASRAKPRVLNVAVLYDCMISMHVSTIREHLEAFRRYSRHRIVFIPATPAFWNLSPEKMQRQIDLTVFDVVIVHYSTRLSVSDHLDEGLARIIERFRGLKLLFIQDEYEGTEIARQWMERLKFDIVYTCVPKVGLEFVYPSVRFPATEFLPTLTGYVPDDPDLEQHILPLRDRKVLIGYRGRRLPAIYGRLGNEKYRIGVDVKRFADSRGLQVDIEVDDKKRIYGAGWYRFLGSSRATLGTESGSNVFDVDGSLRQQVARIEAQNPQITFDEIEAQILKLHESPIQMNQISPKVFEAIRLRTALIMFEGAYSDVVLPHEHYIPLKKDYSNIDHVFAKLQDDAYIEALTERAYRDIIGTSRYSYRAFIDNLDNDILARTIRGSQYALFLAPVVAAALDGSHRIAVPLLAIGAAEGALPLSLEMLGKQYAAFQEIQTQESHVQKALILADRPRPVWSITYRWARAAWRLLPMQVRFRVWQSLPVSIRSRIARI